MATRARLYRHCLWLLVVALASLLLTNPPNAVASADKTHAAPAMVRIPGHMLPALAKANIVPSKANENDQPMTLTIVLRHDDEAGLNRYLRELYDPHSPNFHHFLKQSEIADRFGPSRAHYDDLLRYMHAHGFTLTQGSKNRLTLTVRGTRAEAERAFDVSIAKFRLGRHTFYSNDRDPALPSELAMRTQSVVGLSNFAEPHPTWAAESNANAAIYCQIASIACVEQRFNRDNWQKYCFNTIKNAVGSSNWLYVQSIVDKLDCTKTALRESPHAGPLTESSTKSTDVSSPPDGTGQTIALVEFDSFHPSDVVDYLNYLGFPSTQINNLSAVNVDGGVATPGANEQEVLLDIDTVMTLASGAKVVVYDAPFSGAGTSFQAVFNAAITGGATVISNSWAYCEDQTTLADVESIDTIFKDAAASGISILNGSGDNGNTCLDGSTGVIGVPADSPDATAVGASSLSTGNGFTYDSETWWDGINATPPTGQGGFGVSKFFSAPGYQSALNPSPMRSIPDVVFSGDPATGVEICEADKGGCPSGLLYGGTSYSAPAWAGLVAQLNQAQGHNLGLLNPLLYPLVGSDAFHSATSMGSDFEHVGLGSPNYSALNVSLSGQTVGLPSASVSSVTQWISPAPDGSVPAGVPADGTTQTYVVVTLFDANGNTVSGKSVTIAPNGGGATVTPPSAVTNVSNGSAVFTVTDTNPENIVFSATDQTDGIPLSQQPTVTFAVPPAVSAGIVASLSTDPADGSTADTITVTLKDSLGRPTPGKVVTLDQGGASSAITAPSPAITDSNGEIKFSVTDLHTENVTYTGTDVSDDSVPVPGSAMVDFTNGGGGCASASYVTGTANPAPGYAVSAFATGFFVSSGDQGFSYNCFGAYGMAWDAAGNMYVTDFPTGKVYKFGTAGGAADAGHLFTTVKAPATGLAIDPAGNMFASEGSVSGANGDIVPVDLSNGTVGTAIASGIPCLGNMAIDPAIPALYVNDFCSSGPVSPDIWQVTGIDGASPATVVYAETPDNIENLNLAVAPDGAVYDVYAAATGAPIARIAPGGSPVTTLTAAGGSPISLTGGLGMTVGGKQASGDAEFIIAPFNPQLSAVSGPDEAVSTLDLTGASPALGAQLTTTDFSGLSNFAIGPDGCLYVAGGPTVSRITNTDGTCTFGPATQPPTINLSPAAVTPNPAQGTSQSFTATLLYAGTPSGSPVVLTTTGANPQTLLAKTNSSGQANFSYIGLYSGLDSVTASAVVNSTTVSSNLAQVMWTSGTDVTFLTLNQSPSSSMVNQTVTLSSNLTDISQKPAVAVSGEQVNFTLGGSGCEGTTDAKGNAKCHVTPNGAGVDTLSANFAGTAQLNSSSDSRSFNVVAMPTPTPVPGKLKLSPKKLNFGSVAIGSSATKSVKVTNAGKVKKKKVPLPILIEMETGATNPFTVTQACDDDDLGPRSKGVKAGTCTVMVKFTPTAAMKFTGTLVIDTNLEVAPDKSVKLEGSGKAMK
jgi:hypothetical protein